MQRTFQIPNRNCRLIFHIPIPLSKGIFIFQILAIFKLYNAKSPLLPYTTFTSNFSQYLILIWTIVVTLLVKHFVI